MLRRRIEFERAFVRGNGRGGVSFPVRTAKVKNTGGRDGDEVVQVYFRHVKSAQPQPKLALCGFARIPIAAGKTALVSVNIPVERLRYWDTATKNYVVEPGGYEFLIGGASDDLPEKLPLTVKRILDSSYLSWEHHGNNN